jgi:prephenate dehydratase
VAGVMEAMRVGVPGGPHTFAGSAAADISAHVRPLVPVWFDRTEAMVEALHRGDIDGILLRPETTATGPGSVYRLLRGSAVQVAGEYVVPFRCLLLARPGARTSEIKQVFGHGAVHECSRRLGELLPHATVTATERISYESARDVAAGDGTTAVVANAHTAAELGLDVLADNIDNGAVGVWWLLVRDAPIRGPVATVVLRTSDPTASVTAVVLALDRAGFAVRALVGERVSGAPFRYGYVLVADARSGRAWLPEGWSVPGWAVAGAVASLAEES